MPAQQAAQANDQRPEYQHECGRDTDQHTDVTDQHTAVTHQRTDVVRYCCRSLNARPKLMLASPRHGCNTSTRRIRGSTVRSAGITNPTTWLLQGEAHDEAQHASRTAAHRTLTGRGGDGPDAELR